MTLNSQNINFETLESIAADACKRLETSSRADRARWINAIKKGLNELQENCYWQYDGAALLIKSDTSDKIYTSNGKCFDSDDEPCKAFARRMPCRHRAAARLLERYAEQS